MSDDAQRWKDKYLQNLETQERLERRWDNRLGLLRRGLVRSSLAAEGTDKAIDQCMQELREIIRRDDMDSGLAGLIPRLEKVALESETRRQERNGQIVVALSSLVNQLQQLPVPREISKPLKRLGKDLAERAAQFRELPAVLSELSELQRQALGALDAADTTRPGFFQRLFGGREVEADQNQPPTAATVDEAPEDPAAPEDSVLGSVQLPAAPASAASALDSLPMSVDVLSGKEAADYSLPQTVEPGFSSIAPHISSSLLGLLDQLELPERHLPQGEELRKRMQGGLNWYELV